MEGWINFFSNCLLVLLVAIQSSTRVTAKICPLCGTQPVPFPLSTDSTCGDPTYKIRCSPAASTLFLDAINYSYPITSISPSSQLLTINTSFIENESCISSDFNSEGFQLNESQPFSVTSSNMIMLFNCTPQILQAPINCSSNSPCHQFPKKRCQALPLCCTYGAGGSTTLHSIRGLGTRYCTAYSSFITQGTTQPVDTWFSKPGVELKWVTPREPVCQTQEDCEDTAKTNCTVDPDSVGATMMLKRCFCISPLVWNSITGICEQSAFLKSYEYDTIV